MYKVVQYDDDEIMHMDEYESNYSLIFMAAYIPLLTNYYAK